MVTQRFRRVHKKLKQCHLRVVILKSGIMYFLYVLRTFHPFYFFIFLYYIHFLNTLYSLHYLCSLYHLDHFMYFCCVLWLAPAHTISPFCRCLYSLYFPGIESVIIGMCILKVIMRIFIRTRDKDSKEES